MAKKKATMTLKDFHGGSIPSDLPLPSAPGVIVRQPDRGSFDRQAAWGNPAGKSDHRLRPGSAGAVKNFEDRTPFFTSSAHIGRNFDEDERKPLDGVSAPRRTISDDSIQALPSRVEPKMDRVAASRAVARLASTPASQYSSGAVGGSYAGRFPEANNTGVGYQSSGGSNVAGGNYQNVGGNNGQVASAPHANAWGLKKEAVSVKEPVSPALSAPDAASKLAHASALEKVSSGRWHSKQQVTPQVDTEVVRHAELERGSQYRSSVMYNKDVSNATDMVGHMKQTDASLGRHAERSLTTDDKIYGSGKGFPAYETARSPTYMEAKERNPSVNVNGLQPPRGAARSGTYESQPSVPSETTERPKLKLLPRSKPLEYVEPPVDYKQGQQPSEPRHVENGSLSQESVNTVRTGFVGPDSPDRGVERPKLNLKPRSQPLEPLEGDGESNRNSVFGGGRPRELVLKRRGIEDAAANIPEVGQAPYRVRQEVQKTEIVTQHAAATRYDNKVEKLPTDRRTAKNTDRRDHRNDVDRTDMQRRNWRNGNWRNNREIEKRHQQQQPESQERPPSPETWRKPVEPQKPTSTDAPGLRYGKIASAVELAQAFSRSVSDPATPDHFPPQRSLPGRGQMPFSRLTGPTPRPQINGY